MKRSQFQPQLFCWNTYGSAMKAYVVSNCICFLGSTQRNSGPTSWLQCLKFSLSLVCACGKRQLWTQRLQIRNCLKVCSSLTFGWMLTCRRSTCTYGATKGFVCPIAGGILWSSSPAIFRKPVLLDPLDYFGALLQTLPGSPAPPPAQAPQSEAARGSQT